MLNQGMASGLILAVSISEQKGQRKKNVTSAFLIPDWGMQGDAHAGPGHRQQSLLALESIRRMQLLGLAVGPVDFAENVATSGIDLMAFQPGDRLVLGCTEIEITQIGKECHARCEIYRQAGDCVMPREGLFVRVLRGGELRTGDIIQPSLQADGTVMSV